MKFSIITPTYKRKDLLVRAVSSVLAQTHKDWEMIIVNDSPSDASYQDFTSSLNDPRIQYHKNETNRGVNYTRNRALGAVSADSKWVIFLDDDDYLAPDALKNFYNLIITNQEQKWFVTNRAEKTGKSMTFFPRNESLYFYAWSYLITKRCKGDATHCIETKLITQTKSSFLNHVKQGEEWFFFYQLGLHTKLYYEDHNSTISDGYDITSGLNFRKRSFRERYETLVTIVYEAIQRKIITPSFVTYIFLRIIKLIIK